VTADSFHALTRHLRRPAFLLDERGRILALNPTARVLLDTRSDVEGTLLAEHVADDRARVTEALRIWISSGSFAGRDLDFLRAGRPAIRCRAEGMRVARADEAGTPLVLVRCTGVDLAPPATTSSNGRGTAPRGAAPATTAAEGPRAPVEGPRAPAVRTPPMELVSNIAGGIAHEFNNLLTVIQAEAEWALRREADAAVVESLAAIRDAGEQASGLVESLLAYARRQFVRTEEFDLRELVEEALPAELGLGEGGPTPVVRQASCTLPVAADRRQIRQALLNVVVNAKQAAGRDGHVWIRTRAETVTPRLAATRPGAAAGRFAVLEIADDGPGMTKAVAARVFEPFFTTRADQGAHGLGLSQAYGIVKQANGYIHLVSAPDAGTAVSLYLPLRDLQQRSGDRTGAAAP